MNTSRIAVVDRITIQMLHVAKLMHAAFCEPNFRHHCNRRWCSKFCMQHTVNLTLGTTVTGEYTSRMCLPPTGCHNELVGNNSSIDWVLSRILLKYCAIGLFLRMQNVKHVNYRCNNAVLAFTLTIGSIERVPVLVEGP